MEGKSTIVLIILGLMVIATPLSRRVIAGVGRTTSKDAPVEPEVPLGQIKFYCVKEKVHFSTGKIDSVRFCGSRLFAVARHEPGCGTNAYARVRLVQKHDIQPGDIVELCSGVFRVYEGLVPFKTYVNRPYETSGCIVYPREVHKVYRPIGD